MNNRLEEENSYGKDPGNIFQQKYRENLLIKIKRCL